MNTESRIFGTALLLFFASTTNAQFPMPTTDGLMASDSKTLDLMPAMLQVSIQIEGKSSDLNVAIKELKRRVDVAKERLEKLGAVADSINVGSPALQGSSGGDAQQQRQMQMMMQQYGGGKKGKEMLDKTKSVTIAQTVTARWKLADGEKLDRLMEVQELTTKIRSADIGSSADKQPLSEAQQELAEEMAAMQQEYNYGAQKTKAGEPAFVYVATLDNKTYQNAIAEAFEGASAELDALVGAMKLDVGLSAAKPLSVNLSVGQADEFQMYRGRNSANPKLKKIDGAREVLSPDPISATCTVTVTVIAKHK